MLGIVHSGILVKRLRALVLGALVVMAAVRFVPLGAVLFYIGSAATMLALWPLAYEMSRHQESGALSKRQPWQADHTVRCELDRRERNQTLIPRRPSLRRSRRYLGYRYETRDAALCRPWSAAFASSMR